MSHQQNKKQRFTDLSTDQMTVGHLNVELLANILGYLDGPKDIMLKRQVCKKFKEAVKITIVPLTDFRVGSVEKYNDMVVMATEMPNLQQIELFYLGRANSHKYSDGEDPNEELAAATSGYTSLDIEIISNFRKLCILEIESTPFNGRYPFLFNFPLLQKLSIRFCHNLKWDLEMLSGLPLLKELDCRINKRLTGNINSLRVLKDKLEKVYIIRCENIQGNFMDLADFPHLKVLNLFDTAVTGDIREISENDFQAIERLDLPERVYGGQGSKFQRISDAPALMRAVYLLKKQRPALKLEGWYGQLSRDSPDWYRQTANYPPPFLIRFVKAGSRVGYRWGAGYRSCCEVNWLDPEPDRESNEYGEYIEELQRIESRVNMFRGCHQPPTEEEYHRLVEVAPPPRRGLSIFEEVAVIADILSNREE